MRTFDDYTAALVARARVTEGVGGLVLLGSASTAAAGRRDEWSDHDFYLATTDEAADRLRRDAPFLPDPERIVALAHEGGLGVSVLYDELYLMEMAVGTVAQISALPTSGDHEVVMGPGPGTRSAPPAVDALDEAILTLVKLLVGTGRVRRGERLNGSAFVRVYALGHLIAAVRAGFPRPSRRSATSSTAGGGSSASTPRSASGSAGWSTRRWTRPRKARTTPCASSSNRDGPTSPPRPPTSWRLASVGHSMAGN